MKPVLVLYIPVLHEGYVRLLKKYKEKIDVLYVIGGDLIGESMPLHKEIRALAPRDIKKTIEALELAPAVKILHRKSLSELAHRTLIVANEELSNNILKKYLPKKRASIENVFLRWDEKSVLVSTPVTAEKHAPYSRLDAKMMFRADALSSASSDWWRQVGAVIAKGNKVLVESFNRHVPSAHLQYIEGDPRDFVTAGKNPELSTALHAEQSAISDAAKRGVRLEGSSIYVSAFPCPVCAKLIAYAGIKKCFFRKGSATLDGERILKQNNVAIIRIK